MEISVKKNTVICREGDLDQNLFYIMSGKFLICTRSGHMVTPIAYLTENQYLGEMSFFDRQPRSADVIAIEDSTYLQIPQAELKKEFPLWLLAMTKGMTRKLRVFDEVIKDNGIKRSQDQAIKPLSHEEQKFYYELLNNS